MFKLHLSRNESTETLGLKVIKDNINRELL